MRIALALMIALTVMPQAPASPVVRDLDGRSWTPLAPASGETNLLIFVNAECPISRRYAPEMDRVIADYAKKGVRAWFVFADASTEPAAARAHLASFHPKSTTRAVIDVGQSLTIATGVTVTPEVAIFTRTGRVYRGRIDDLYVSLGQSRREPTRHDLRDALDAVLAGRPVAQPETRAIGCFIERKGR
jgi:protein-disulfide isomerase